MAAARVSGVSLVLVLALSCAALAAAQPNYKQVTIQILEVAVPTSQINVGTEFGSPQNFRNDLFDFNTGAAIGHDQGQCVFTQALEPSGKYELECDFTFVLQEGSFTVSGQFKDTPTTLAVLGGTGIYSGATGVCEQSTLTDDGQGNTSWGHNCIFFVLDPPLYRDPLSLKTGVAPVNGKCTAPSANPNQCYASDGKSSICCPAGCPSKPTLTAACG